MLLLTLRETYALNGLSSFKNLRRKGGKFDHRPCRPKVLLRHWSWRLRPPSYDNIGLRPASVFVSVLYFWGPIHRHCHKIYLTIWLRTIGTRKLRYPKMIVRHVLSQFTELVLNDRKICQSWDMS